jgi:hypothetical protein
MVDAPIHRRFGDFYRLAALEPEPARVELRWKSVLTISSSASVDVWLDLLRFLFELRPHTDPAVKSLRDACFSHDATFPSEGAEVELRVLTAIAVLHGLDTSEKFALPLALGLLAGDCRGHRSLGPFASLLERAREVLAQRAVAVRSRDRLPVPQDLKGVAEFTKSLDEFKKQDQPTTIRDFAHPLFTVLQSWHRDTHKQTVQMVKKANHAIDVLSEESNILWWLLSEHCQELRQPVAAIPAPVASIVLARELAQLAQFVPAPHASQAFLARLIKQAVPAAGPTTVGEAVVALDAAWRTALRSDTLSHRTGDLSPILVAITKSLDGDKVSDWQTSYQKATRLSPTITLDPQSLSQQMLDELMLARSVAEL